MSSIASPSKLKPVAQLFTSIPSFFHQTSSAISEVVTIILKKNAFTHLLFLADTKMYNRKINYCNYKTIYNISTNFTKYSFKNTMFQLNQFMDEKVESRIL